MPTYTVVMTAERAAFTEAPTSERYETGVERYYKKSKKLDEEYRVLASCETEAESVAEDMLRNEYEDMHHDVTDVKIVEVRRED